MARRARARVAKPAQQPAPRQQRGSFDAGASIDRTSAGFENPAEASALEGVALAMTLAPIAAAHMRSGR